MNGSKNKKMDVDGLLRDLFHEGLPKKKDSLKDLFDQRLIELKISETTALKIMDMSTRTLKGILDGTLTLLDVTNLIKLANFLLVPSEMVVQLYLNSIEQNVLNEEAYPIDKAEFIKNNFDLVELRKAGFIDSSTDFTQIEKRITDYFGLKSIFDYSLPEDEIAFSSGIIQPKNKFTRGFWINSAKNFLIELDNPYTYDRQKLIDFFPEIRWHSTNVDLGLIDIIKALYKIGISVIYQPSFSSLHLRGATFSVNSKPCVILTNYRGFYATLWFALVHELFHVLFDWEEIFAKKYHLTDDDNDLLSVKEKENEADGFAREYLFSKEKTDRIRPYLYDSNQVNQFTTVNHVHPSFAYQFIAYDKGKADRTAWARARKNNPSMEKLLNPITNSWKMPLPIAVFAGSLKYKLYK